MDTVNLSQQDSVQDLGKLNLKNFLKLNEFSLKDREVSDEMAKELADFIKNHNFIKEIYFKSLKLSDDGINTIFKAFNFNKKILLLNMACTKFPSTGQDFLSNLKNNNSVSEIGFSNCDISDDIAEKIAFVIEGNQNINLLNLYDNKILDKGVNFIANSIKFNTSLMWLSLGKNKISDEGATSISEVLKENPTLKYLSLGSNLIRDKGAEYIANSFDKNSYLTKIYLYDNYLTNHGAKIILENLEKNETLIIVDLESNHIDREILIKIENKLKKREIRLNERAERKEARFNLSN
jgi:Ran GTPase-activating protein (RanGAP) involved in mRNA processing and transport